MVLLTKGVLACKRQFDKELKTTQTMKLRKIHANISTSAPWKHQSWFHHILPQFLATKSTQLWKTRQR